MPRDQEIHKASKLGQNIHSEGTNVIVKLAFIDIGKDDDVVELLKNGVDPNLRGAQNRRAIHRAVGNGHHELVQVSDL